MRPDFLRRGGLLALTLYLFAAAPVFAIASLINATLQPSQISMGESAELTITSSGSSMGPVALPEVAGLEFRVIGQSHRIEIINGAMLVTTALIVRVTPKAVGIFTIPGITPKSEPLVLRVNPEGSGNSSVLGNLNGSGKSPAGVRADGIRLTADGSAFVRLILPKRDVYVGESIPVDIEMGMRNGFVTSLNGLPTLTGADFTLNNLSHQPERVPKLIDGKEFTLLTWHSLLAAVKPGKFSLSVESPLTVRIRTRPQRESLLEDSLGDPFMQNFFGATVPKDITVASPPAELTVLSLPSEGRPPQFSGAVGSFKIASDLSATTAAAGDPLTLRMQVSGAGNFDRVDSAMLQRLDTWKTYPPKSSFKPSDPAGYNGEKTFEQPLIASQPGVQTLPGVTFSYFDPSTRRYETARSPPLAVTISPSLADTSSSASASSVTAAAATGTGTPANSPGLRPDHVAAAGEAGQNSLIPLYLQPRFLAIPSLLSLAFAGGWLGLRRRASASIDPRDGRDRVVTKATQRAVMTLQAAARAGSAILFFNAARSALLGTVGVGLDAESDEIRQLFALADEANYSGQQPTTTEFERWIEIVRRRLLNGQPP
jgi:hypothetical protein